MIENEPQSTPERITMNGDDWTCLCGNEAHLDGFYPYMSDPAREVEPTPENWTSNAYFCASCLRAFDAQTGAVSERPDAITGIEGNVYTQST